MRPRAAIRGCRLLGQVGPIIVLAALLLARSEAAAAQDETRQLTVTVAVCPAGAGDPSPERCETRVARAFAVSVLDAAANPLAEDVAPGAAGRARAALPAAPDGELRVIVDTAVNVGSRAVSCEADGEPVAATLGGGAAAIPVFRVALPAEGDIACVVYLFGFPDDADVLDIIPSTGTPVAVAVGTPGATPTAGNQSRHSDPTGRDTTCAAKD